MGPNDLVSAYAVDIVFCIDCTGSMRPYLASVKATANQFHTLLQRAMQAKDKQVSQLRVRVVAYRDLGNEGPDAIEATPFFSLPTQVGRFQAYVEGLRATGGGDEPESGLEALHVALRSPWETSLGRRRHVVVVCTDASAHPLGRFTMNQVAGPPPTRLGALEAIWGDAADEGEMEFKAKRLVLFAPDMTPWNEIAETWENTLWFPAKAATGLEESDQQYIIEQIAGSL